MIQRNLPVHFSMTTKSVISMRKQTEAIDWRYSRDTYLSTSTYIYNIYIYYIYKKLKISEMLMAIFLVYSTSGITSGKKVCREIKMATILKILKY